MSTTQITAEPGSHEIAITRDLKAPPELVYRAFADADLVAQWLGPRALTMKVDAHDLRHGGTWRYIHVSSDGGEHGFRGCFHGDPSVENGITRTFEYDGAPGHASLEKATFEAIPGGTRLRMSSVHQTVEARDAHLASGMESGVKEGFERMDELLARLSPASS